MKKALCSTAAAALFIFALSGCADTAPIQTEGHPPQPTVEISLEPSAEPTGAVESEAISFSAGNAPLAQDSTANEDGENPVKLELPAEQSPTPAPQTAQVPQVTPAPQAVQAPQESPAPQETPPPAKGTIKFDVTTQKGAGENPAPSTTPEPEPTPVPPAQSEPPVEPTPTAFNIDHWITYAQNYARSAGLNLDPTATACWDNPITAGAHCTYLERDLQSRLNRYAIFVTGGGGAHSGARGSAVFGVNVFTGHNAGRWERQDMMGEVRPEHLPQWVKERLPVIQRERALERGRHDAR